MPDFVSIPLDIELSPVPSLALQNGSVEERIDRMLDLIVFTPRGSFSADPEFGFEYWNHEFSNLNVREFNNSYIGMMGDVQSLNDVTKKQCETSIRESILQYESQLLNPSVKIELVVNEKIRPKKSQSKYEMKILISGQIDDGLGVVKPYDKRISFMVEPTAKKINI